MKRYTKNFFKIIFVSFAFLFIGISSSVLSYIFLQAKSEDYFLRKKLDSLTIRLKFSYIQSKNTGTKWNFFSSNLWKKDDLINSFWHNIEKSTTLADQYLYSYFENDRLPGGYIDSLNDNLIIGVNGKGEVFSFNLINNKFSPINSNLNQILKDQNYKENEKQILYGKFGMRDIFVDRKDDRILASFWSDITGEGCYGMSIYEASLLGIENERSLKFKPFFKTDDCNNKTTGHASGGRIKRYEDKIIFTVGSLDKKNSSARRKSESLNNAIGKVIAISPDKSYKILSYGHRNQQGLEIVNQRIIISEHGPRGGDEINSIEPNKGPFHYGWPFYSYGITYDYKDIHRAPHQSGYKKPIYYFSPAIAPSEIIFYKGEEFPNWKDKLILSTLKDQSLYLLDYDIENDKILSSEKISIGHRIRDLCLLESGKIIVLTDDQKIIKLSNSDLPVTSGDYPKVSL